MSLSRRTCAIAATAFSLTILTTGCNSKVAQCNKLIKVANAATTELKTISKSGGSKGDRIKQMEQFSTALDKHSKAVQNVELEDEQLQGFQKRLSDLYISTSKASNGMIAAAKAKNIKGLKASLKTLSSGAKTETDVVSSINSYCQAK
ncbi:hypothetical protein IQ266_10795 [filamentous cyanobacterium LEGE 11480]|uniref:Lipoprotein n=1 Tax=Romeriopsis navalis LEGE 11480 TaxID=2777977 RepID=A0A928VPL7_9CYAN|nr:hypothetical protein [Romeriopsis navalis]MBE9030217.1 hypothetical protein [Romeriopsis navalis LEGE 11480]